MKKMLMLFLLLAPRLYCGDVVSSVDTAATAIAMNGQVFYESESGALKPVELGQLFGENDRVVTKGNSALQLVLGDGSTLALGSNSELSIASVGKGGAESKSFFQLVKGRVNAIVQKLTQGASFEVRTANSVAAVKGTQFEVSADEASSAVTVREGTVATSDPSRSKVVMVPPMHQSVVAASGPQEARTLSKKEADEFEGRWAEARRVHEKRTDLLKRFEEKRPAQLAALKVRQSALKERHLKSQKAQEKQLKSASHSDEGKGTSREVSPEKPHKSSKHKHPKHV